MITLSLLVGVVLLLLGRRIYWLFVGGVGFVAAMTLVTRLTNVQRDWLVILIALAAGVVGAVLAVLLQRVAIGIGGFLAGGYIVLSLLDLVEIGTPMVSWLLAMVGGIIGVVLASLLFDWALILLSSLVGASMVAQSLSLRDSLTALVFLVALVVGVVFQAGLMGRDPGDRRRVRDR